MSVDAEKLLEEGFTLDQVNEIREGAADGLDTSLYARKEFLAIQMRQIRLGMKAGLQVESYARVEYDWFQMEEIRRGMQAGLAIERYASPKISYDRMRQIRKGLSAGLDLSPYAKFDARILRQLRKALLSRVNIVPYIRQGYGAEQLEEIRLAMEQGIDVSPYLLKELRGASIHEIRKGLERGVDVSSYAKIEYSWQQMREIRLGLENRMDISFYISPYYSWQQMREIRLGLESGLDVSTYRSLMYTANDMQKRRLSLLESGLEIVPQLKSLSDGEAAFEGFTISISSNEMEAWLTVTGNVKKLERETVLYALKKSGIQHGVKEDAVRQLAARTYLSQKLLIAKGTPAQDGGDGWYEYFFRTEVDSTPKLLEDGSVDYQSIEWFEMVKAGQKIAYYHAAGDGTNGTTVTGRVLHAKRGCEKPILSGSGFVLQEDKKTYVAETDGRIELFDKRLEISRTLIVEEMTQASGNIRFDGSVYVKGRMGSGTAIYAAEDVVVDGFVESAVIECGGDIVLRQGVNASGNGWLKAGGDVFGQFFEAVQMESGGNIEANYCLNCEIQAKGVITISGKNGVLAGGTAKAGGGINAYNLGNRAGLATSLFVGASDDIIKKKRQLEDEVEEVNQQLELLGNGYLELQKKYPPEVRNTMEMYLKLESAISTKEQQMQKLMEKMQAVEEKLENVKQAKVVVAGQMYEGVSIEVNGLRWRSKKAKNVTIKRTMNRISVYGNK